MGIYRSGKVTAGVSFYYKCDYPHLRKADCISECFQTEISLTVLLDRSKHQSSVSRRAIDTDCWCQLVWYSHPLIRIK